MMEKKQALKTDTTLESLLATPVRGAMALAAPLRGKAAAKAKPNTDIDGLIGKDVELNARFKKMFRDPNAPTKEELKRAQTVLDLQRVKKSVSRDTTRSQLAGAGFGADRAFNSDDYKKGGTVKKATYKASSRADGIAKKGKTKGRMI
jgi:hypothetical protein